MGLLKWRDEEDVWSEDEKEKLGKEEITYSWRKVLEV